ncbi:MAG: transglutaminase-like domain-containing protein [Bacteroidota bacterium]
MKHSIGLLASLFLFLASNINAQTNLPLIRSNVELIDIRNGDDFSAQNWSLVYDLKPDVYTTNKIGERVTFYTDLDSISCIIHPDSVYDFVILHNGKDSAFTQIRYQKSYLDILKEAEAYDSKVDVAIPQFTYQSANVAELKAFRAAFNLDSIAGQGNEISKIINLMNWVHDLVPHDGQHENPVVKNAMSMIKECKRDERGLNCRGLATVLNEAYLSMGIPSRHITCMPKDSVFNDCHVINMVYSSELEKWVWMDPTHAAYVMDETGQLLDPFEVRERLIKDQPLILNPNANWNRRASTLKENYLEHYMAKNLYRFETPLESRYNYETAQKDRTVTYVELVPLDGYQLDKRSEQYYEKSNTTAVQYQTNYPEVFWAKPE